MQAIRIALTLVAIFAVTSIVWTLVEDYFEARKEKK